MPQEDLKDFKEFIGVFDKSIESQDFQQLIKLVPLVDEYEENFLNGYFNRKKEGVFYTNKEISDFIVSEALINLINNKLKKYNNEYKKIQSFNEVYKLTGGFKQKLRETLLNISICDPACGSGGFLLSSADIIYTILNNLNPNQNELSVKNQILKNLYGFDINENAIKLCILKLIGWYQNRADNSLVETLAILKCNLNMKNSIINSDFPKFDIILGNPPYGNILNQKEKEILKKEKIFHKDIYCSFLLKALDWSNEVIGFLVPKSFLLRQGYIRFRDNLLSKANILKIFDIGSKMFKTATNEVLIILYESKKSHNNRDLEVFNYPKTKIITYHNQNVDSLRICLNLDCPFSLRAKKLYVYSFKENCPVCGLSTLELNRIRIKPSEEIYKLIEKIENISDLNYLNPLDFPKMIRGEEEKGLKIVKENLRNDTNGSCFFISARNDFNYYNFKRNKSFKIGDVDSKILKGNNYEYYLKPKLLIKHNNIIPEALYTEENVCFTSSIYSLLHDNNDELKYLCAILNSALIQFYCIYGINNQKDTTINLNQYMIRHLPIVNSDNIIKTKIVEKVDRINNLLILKNQLFDESIYQLLKEIDNIIFTQYSITDVEKNLIISEVKNQIKYFDTIYSK
ncbi:MAG: Eco57I restriction-modification methylase domain-containing protein [Promethearchaeota archaeon]